jgi:hypothetical protein
MAKCKEKYSISGIGFNDLISGKVVKTYHIIKNDKIVVKCWKKSLSLRILDMLNEPRKKSPSRNPNNKHNACDTVEG